MKSMKMIVWMLAAAVLLGGCAAPAGSAGKTAEPEAAAEESVVRVTTAEELTAAVAPGAVVELAEGVFALTPPEGGGEVNDYCCWVETYDGYELQIHDAAGLTIRGAGLDKTTISAAPRYANVLAFRNCPDLTVAELTAGHTEAPGECAGGVLWFESCRGVRVENCGLYGCGIVGVQTQECEDVTVRGTKIYDCSYSAVTAYLSRNVLVDECEVFSCGGRGGMAAMNLFSVYGGEGFTVIHTQVHDNLAQSLLGAYQAAGVRFLSGEVRDNRFEGVMFDLERYTAVVDGCALVNNRIGGWNGALAPWDALGRTLDEGALETMTLEEIDPETVRAPMPAKAVEVEPGGEISVATVDELLAAIGPDRTIRLAPGIYDLSTADGYGGAGGEYYYWQTNYDGPGLIVSGVTGLTIRADSDDAAATVISAAPRYSDVLFFRDCGDLALEGFTAGHTEAPGECAGGVLFFDNCSGVELTSCRLYGCGVLGIQGNGCTGLRVRGCEIYECSYGAISLYCSETAVFSDCDIHDVPSPSVFFETCRDLVWNGRAVDEGIYSVNADGTLRGAADDAESVDPYASWTGAPFRENGPELSFALTVQRVFADGDWEGLADLASFPLRIYTARGSYVFPDRASLNAGTLDELLPAEFRRQVACAPLTEYRQTSFGSVFADNSLAFEYVAAADGVELRLTNISTLGNLF